MQHSKVVGGSTAKRVINCPGSVALVQRMPPQIASKYAEEGTLLHNCMEELADGSSLGELTQRRFLTEAQIEKLEFCQRALDEIDPEQRMLFIQEAKVEFEGVKALEGVFGSADLVGRIGDRAIILDWKFGDGVMVNAEENDQGLFYAAAAAKTSALGWAMDGATEIEIIIVQPPRISRWVTDWKRIERFQADLVNAVKLASKPDAPLEIGDWCRWCTGKPICPKMTGSIDRAVNTALQGISGEDLGRALQLADKLESFIHDARALAQARLEKNIPVPGYKLVAKRATRQWADEGRAARVLGEDFIETKTALLSPAQAEKLLKKRGLTLPDDLIVAVSSGNTVAPQDDPRPAVMVLGEQLRAALSRVQ